MKKEDGRKLHPKAQEAIRVRIVAFLKSGKGTQQEAADIFMVNLRTVKKIWKQYKEVGIKAIRSKKRGPSKSTSRLSRPQIKEVTQLIRKGTPDTYGISYYLWTADAARLLIKKTG
jgi:transposase